MGFGSCVTAKEIPVEVISHRASNSKCLNKTEHIQYELMISARVWLFACGKPVVVDARNTVVEPCSSLPAANVSLNTAELLVFLSTALVAI